MITNNRRQLNLQQTPRSLGPDVMAGQVWISTRDGRTRPEHADADGQVVPIGTPFNIGGASLAYPGDPAADRPTRSTAAARSPS